MRLQQYLILKCNPWVSLWREISWSPGQCIWFGAQSTWTVMDLEIEPWEVFCPSGLTTIEMLSRHKVFKVLMITEYLDLKWAPLKLSSSAGNSPKIQSMPCFSKSRSVGEYVTGQSVDYLHFGLASKNPWGPKKANRLTSFICNWRSSDTIGIVNRGLQHRRISSPEVLMG